jgi:hypothetical protein
MRTSRRACARERVHFGHAQDEAMISKAASASAKSDEPSTGPHIGARPLSRRIPHRQALRGLQQQLAGPGAVDSTSYVVHAPSPYSLQACAATREPPVRDRRAVRPSSRAEGMWPPSPRRSRRPRLAPPHSVAIHSLCPACRSRSRQEPHSWPTPSHGDRPTMGRAAILFAHLRAREFLRPRHASTAPIPRSLAWR